MDFGLKDKVAIVTGSSQGIGKSIAHALSIEGTRTVICARDSDRLKKAAQEIETSSKKAILPVKTDLRDKEEIRSLVRTTIEKFGRVDILVNNTGGPQLSLFLETSEEDWYYTMKSLLMSVIHCCWEVIPHMRKQRGGRIINMTSFVAKQPAERMILSNTIRAGILGLTKSLSNELAEDGILVNAVCPGWTLTKRVEELAISTAEKTGKKYEEVISGWTTNIPLKRLAKPEEIANLVVFLASERASYITGSVIQVDGGFIKSLL